MKAKVIAVAVLAATVASPAFAATYFIVQSNKTHKCSVASSKPTAASKTRVLVGNDAGYASKKEATAAIATVDACKAAT